MRRAELIALANRFFPDGQLAEYHDEEGNFVDNPHGGDSIARFVVIELNEAVDLEQPDEVALSQAKGAIHRGIDDLCAVLAGLDGLVNWRS